jgi:hypothetical protein
MAGISENKRRKELTAVREENGGTRKRGDAEIAESKERKQQEKKRRR